ncbi:MAG: nuclease [Inquilinus sp.]|nr:nuclease [Inquilinus sp.]
MSARALLLLVALQLAGPGAVRAAEVIAGPIPATVLEVIDGDTLSVRAEIWLGQAVETRVRLAGIDTPELRGRCPAENVLADAAHSALRNLVGDGPVTLHEIRYGTYAGRVVARVVNGATGDVSASLLAGGFALPYAGRGPRPDWCDLP